MSSPRSSLLSRLLTRSAVFLAALLLASPAAHAIVDDDLLPANLVGKTLTFTHTALTPNTLEPSVNTYRIVFSTASTYVRSSATLTTEGGTYTILDSSIAPNTGGRATTIQINNNWYASGNNTAILLTLTQAAGSGAFAATEFFNPQKNSGGVFTIAGASGGGGTTAAPVITSAATATATVGSAFSYQITTSPAATAYTNAGGNVPISINPTTGLVTGTFSAPGTFNFSFTALNSAGTTKAFTVTVTAVGAAPIALVITSSAALNGTVGVAFNYQITATGSPTSYRLTGQPAFLNFNTTVGTVTGFPTAAGTYAFTVTAINATGSASRNVVLTVAGSASTVAAAPYNLSGYRNRTGQTFQFTATGANAGAIWGTDVYTDDSNLAAAAVHAGVLALGQTKTVTVTILAGQSSYTASDRNGVKSGGYSTWPGSYSFAGAGAVTTGDAAVSIPAAAPGFVLATSTIATGGRLVCPVTVRGGGTYSYRWYLNGTLISGATANPYVVESATVANAGTYAADVTNALGTARLTAGTVTISSAGAPVFSLQPFNKVVAPGGTFALAADASGDGNSYQWLRNGVALSGENGPIILRQNVNAADAGTYAVRVTNGAGTITSANATVTLNPNAAVIANISVRTAATPGQIITPAFTVSGTGKKRVLIRASGPALAAFGLTGVMADPKFDVYDGSTRIAGNDTWDPALTTAFAAVGAFGFPTGSKDAALVLDLDASASGRGYTIQVTGVNNSAGIVLVEVYDLGNPSGASKLTNVSVLTKADTGLSTLILGLVLKGEGQRTLLVRGIGPKLAAFGIGALLTDPKIQVFDNEQRTIITNNDWSGADFVSELVQASGYVGAFALDNNSADSATLALLQPGNYTVQISGNDGGVGNAIIEVYEVP